MKNNQPTIGYQLHPMDEVRTYFYLSGVNSVTSKSSGSRIRNDVSPQGL